MAKHAALTAPHNVSSTLAVRNGGTPYPHVAQLPLTFPRHSATRPTVPPANVHPVFGYDYVPPAATWSNADHRGANR